MEKETLKLPQRNDEPVGFDELGRGPELLSVLHMIVTYPSPLVVGVYGDWGTGKTSFMRTLQALLSPTFRKQYRDVEAESGIDEQHSVPLAAEGVLKKKDENVDELLTVWFNPWQHQFEEDPIFPLLDAIRNSIDASIWGNAKNRLRRIVEDPKYRIIGRASLKAAQMIAPGWLSVLSQQIGDEARDIMAQMSDFQKEFDACLKQITAKKGRKLVIFVDDLDRCEAKYTVRLLEALKLHLLNEHCVFVLGCADERVRMALINQLGITPSQARDYLEKIVQVPVRLASPRLRHVDGLIRRLGWGDLVDNEQTRGLLHALAGRPVNPRRLKRFLHWYSLERSKIDFVPGLEGLTPDVVRDEAVLLKMKMLEYLDERFATDPDRFRIEDTLAAREKRKGRSAGQESEHDD